MLKKLILIAFVVAGCAGQPSSEICNSGIICPSGTKCAAAQAVCLINDCGDGIVDPNETCDDGNIIDGDGCAHDCKKEGCGNGVVDPGEDCDPPGSTTASGTPCSASCKFEVCGNRVIDPDTNEQCDDGSGNTDTPCTTPDYANPPQTCSNCTTSCTIRTVVGPYCGDHVCDAALGEDITSCSQDCMGCGNGSIDPGEECDLGSGNTDTDCGPPAYDNPPKTCSTCTMNCTIKTIVGPYCGNNLCDTGENFTNCPQDCMGCGNGIVEGSEQCDQGVLNTDTKCGPPAYNHSQPNSCTTCTNSCTIDTEYGPFCGDGMCANGETKSTCPTDCIGCGNGRIETGEECDNGAGNTDQKCAKPAYANPPNACSTCTTSCTISTVLGEYCGDNKCDNGEDMTSCPHDCTGCGNGIIDGTEECDYGALNSSGCGTPTYNANPPNTCSYCSLTCHFHTTVGAFCGDGTCDSGNEDATSCPADCAGCGNGVLQGSEECDNGANNTTTCGPPSYQASGPQTCSYCSTSCHLESVVGPFCGDGTCQTANENTTSCPDDCTGCGNGILESATEQCDNGSGNTTSCGPPMYQASGPLSCSYCSLTCQLKTVLGPFCGDNQCNNGEDTTSCPEDCAGCGNGILEGTEKCDDGSLNTNTACTTSVYANPPKTCSVCSLSCTLITTVGPYCGDGIKNDNTEQCDGTDGTTCPVGKTGTAICKSSCKLDTSGCM